MDTTFARAASTSAATAARPRPAPARLDLYAPIHKALRSFMSETLARLGRTDPNDASDLDAGLAQLEALLAQCLSHIEHENRFMHTAIEARLPAGAMRTAMAHREHLERIDALRDEARALRRAPAAERDARALGLYRHLALFVAENFEHMHEEETLNNAALWAHYSDAELAELHERLVATIPPAENLQVARWMIPALPPVERAMVLAHARAGMPAPAFEAALAHVRPHLDDIAWARLARDLGLAQQPGLVDFR